MNFFSKILGKNESPQDNVPEMKLGTDAKNAWYDEKSKRWRFKGEEIKEDDNNRSVLPPKKMLIQEPKNADNVHCNPCNNNVINPKEIMKNTLNTKDIINENPIINNDPNGNQLRPGNSVSKQNDVNTNILRNDHNSSVYV